MFEFALILVFTFFVSLKIPTKSFLVYMGIPALVAPFARVAVVKLALYFIFIFYFRV
jgi:hypothetical protein